MWLLLKKFPFCFFRLQLVWSRISDPESWDFMDNQLYSIGEISKIMGISVQTLRHYCKIGIIKPAYTDPSTGYRYFSYDQLHYIDRARYLLRCGFSLKEIGQILQLGDIDLLIRSLEKKRTEKTQIIEDAIDSVATIDWYKEYFTSALEHSEESMYSVQHIPSRKLVAVKWEKNYAFDSFYFHFGKIRMQKCFSSIHFKRQFVSIWDCESLLNGNFTQR